MDRNPYNQIVPRFSHENALGGYLNGELDSQDFDSNFKLKSDLRARTLLPYERQRLDFRPPLEPLVDSPVDPPKSNPRSPAVSPTVVASVLGAEIRELEAVITAQALAMTQMEIEIRKLKTTRRLLSNLVFSWCEYFKCINARLFD